jgi:NADH:flavin oxidoreductase / NADH oxidase family
LTPKLGNGEGAAEPLRSPFHFRRGPEAMSEQAFPHLFQPLKVRHKTLKHRLNFGAHTANMSVKGLPSERHLGYYRERARGGAAMIVIEPAPVHKAAVLTRGNFLAESDAVIPTSGASPIPATSMAR